MLTFAFHVTKLLLNFLTSECLNGDQYQVDHSIQVNIDNCQIRLCETMLANILLFTRLRNYLAFCNTCNREDIINPIKSVECFGKGRSQIVPIRDIALCEVGRVSFRLIEFRDKRLSGFGVDIDDEYSSPENDIQSALLIPW